VRPARVTVGEREPDPLVVREHGSGATGP